MEKAKKPCYKYCIVPTCKNTTVTAPNKKFFFIPRDPSVREKWCKAIQMDSYSRFSSSYCCEDHFNLEEDTENYIQYKIMELGHGQKVTLRLKKGVLPHKFECRNEENLPRRKKKNVSKRHRLARSAVAPFEVGSSMPYNVDTPLTDNYEAANNFFLPNVKFGNDELQVDKAIQLENDMVNYMEYKIMGAVKTVKLKWDCVPTRFSDRAGDNNTELLEPQSTFDNQAIVTIKQEMDEGESLVDVNEDMTGEEESFKVDDIKVEQDLLFSADDMKVDCVLENLSATQDSDSSTGEDVLICDRGVQAVSKLVDRTTQTTGLVKFRSKRIQVNLPPFLKSTCSATSSTTTSQEQPSPDLRLKFNNQDTSSKPTLIGGTFSRIKKSSKLYIGLAKSFYFFIDVIKSYTDISEADILLCLKKIKLNDSFAILADDFDVSTTQAIQTFFKSLPKIANAILPVSLESFCIIYCMEIGFKQPKSRQFLTGEKRNIVKFLIACTLNGLVSFVSKKYAGNVNNVDLVKDCKFLESLQPGACVIGDSGFDDLEVFLSERGFTFMKSADSSSLCSMPETKVVGTNEIAVLRSHLERVSRRLREFKMLKFNSELNLHLVGSLHLCIKIACGLINLQDTNNLQYPK